MDYRLDQKGKYYTTHVSKRATHVLACVQGVLISGTMHLTLDNRVKDELNSGERFIAITQAQVRELHSGQVLYENDIVILNKDQITWLLPTEETHELSNPGPGTPGP